ncbi:Ribosomal large subunit pseudouridine synthase D [candidate division SR1 bacterium Aalborg_AAW-1]|nr:Ribosomal large subunit pseudouridine synthase D [candidate division SR1 bacterium Aalborg_AAW-1]
MSQKTNIITYEGNGGERIDVYLTKNHEYTRNFFHRLVARGDILVNDTVVKKKSLGLKQGDIITIVHPERYMESEMLALSPAIDLKILVEKKDYLVVYKPKGVLSHPNSVRGVEHVNMVGALYQYFKAQNLPTTGNFIRAGLIHRLDKETDGLMLIVKTEEGLKYFKDLWMQKSSADTIEDKELVPLKKFYRAQILITDKGQQFLDSMTLPPLAGGKPHIIQELVIPKVPHYEPKMGITKVTQLNHIPDSSYAELEVEILTGRTHQIRYHLSQHGLPVRGDYLYMDKKDLDENDIMHLQAYRLQFLDIEGEMMDVECDRSW